VSGAGLDGQAGDVDITTDGDITVRALVNGSAPGSQGFAGFISFDTTFGMVDIQKDVDAIGPFSGGTIDVSSYNGVRVAGRLTADGNQAIIELQGCAVNVTSTGRLSSIGINGKNSCRRAGLTIAGTLQATTSNRIEYRDPTKLPS
jgi:hypothetical protein